MMISSPMMGPTDMVVIGIDEGIHGKVIPIILGIMNRWFLTLRHKKLVMNRNRAGTMLKINAKINIYLEAYQANQ